MLNVQRRNQASRPLARPVGRGSTGSPGKLSDSKLAVAQLQTPTGRVLQHASLPSVEVFVCFYLTLSQNRAEVPGNLKGHPPEALGQELSDTAP